MMASLAIARETFLRLRRDRIFLPAALVGCSMLLLSGLASYWGVEEFFKILYDLGSITWLMTGVTVAIFWGNKIISDSRQEGSLEVQLASPVSRTAWLIGKFFGLSTALILLGLILLFAWQLVYFGYGMGWLTNRILLIYSTLTITWIIMGAISILFASLASAAIALFCSIWIFICGMLTQPIAQSLSKETPEHVRRTVELMAGIWNLHQFDLSVYGAQETALSTVDILSRYQYAGLLLLFCLGLACFFFNRRDLIA